MARKKAKDASEEAPAVETSSLEHSYDSVGDELTVCGVRYSGDWFRMMAGDAVDAKGLVCILKKKDDAIEIEALQRSGFPQDENF